MAFRRRHPARRQANPARRRMARTHRPSRHLRDGTARQPQTGARAAIRAWPCAVPRRMRRDRQGTGRQARVPPTKDHLACRHHRDAALLRADAGAIGHPPIRRSA